MRKQGTLQVVQVARRLMTRDGASGALRATKESSPSTADRSRSGSSSRSAGSRNDRLLTATAGRRRRRAHRPSIRRRASIPRRGGCSDHQNRIDASPVLLSFRPLHQNKRPRQEDFEGRLRAVCRCRLPIFADSPVHPLHHFSISFLQTSASFCDP